MSVERTDEELMGQVQDGDTEAFEKLYDRHARRALGVARAICGDAKRAEGAVRDGFVSIWRGRMRYRPDEGSFEAWAMDIIRSGAVDLGGPRERTLRAALGLLPQAQAEVIALAYFGGLTHAEIAQRLSLPARTVKGRMRLGLETLALEMNGEAEAERTN